MTRAERLAEAKRIRRFIHDNPGKSRGEIYEAIGATSGLAMLEGKRLIRHSFVDGKTVYHCNTGAGVHYSSDRDVVCDVDKINYDK